MFYDRESNRTITFHMLPARLDGRTRWHARNWGKAKNKNRRWPEANSRSGAAEISAHTTDHMPR